MVIHRKLFVMLQLFVPPKSPRRLFKSAAMFHRNLIKCESHIFLSFPHGQKFFLEIFISEIKINIKSAEKKRLLYNRFLCAVTPLSLLIQPLANPSCHRDKIERHSFCINAVKNFSFHSARDPPKRDFATGKLFYV